MKRLGLLWVGRLRATNEGGERNQPGVRLQYIGEVSLGQADMENVLARGDWPTSEKRKRRSKGNTKTLR